MKRINTTITKLGLLLPGMAQEINTTFQTSSHWKPTIDVRSDAVMVYGTQDRPQMTFQERVESWRKRGFTTHFMTGIAWEDTVIISTGNGTENLTWMKDRRI